MSPAAVRRLPAARHRQVGQGDPAGRHQGAMKTITDPERRRRPGTGRSAAARVRGQHRLQDRRRVRRRRRHEGPPAGGRAGRHHDPEPRPDRRAGARRPRGGPVGEGYRRRADRHRGAQRRSRCPRSAAPTSCARPCSPPTRSIFPIPSSRPPASTSPRCCTISASGTPSPTGCGPPPTAPPPCARSPQSKSRRPLGCTQATEIVATPGIVLVAALPPGCDLATVYSCAIAAKAAAPLEAAEFIAMLSGDAGTRLASSAGIRLTSRRYRSGN